MSYRIAAIDVPQRMLAVVIADGAGEGEYQFERRKVGASPDQLRQLAEWLLEQQVREVVMESTAQYWKPVWQALERYWQPVCKQQADGSAVGKSRGFRGVIDDDAAIVHSDRIGADRARDGDRISQEMGVGRSGRGLVRGALCPHAMEQTRQGAMPGPLQPPRGRSGSRWFDLRGELRGMQRRRDGGRGHPGGSAA